MDVKLVSRGTEGEVLLIGRLDANSAPEVEEIFREIMGRFDRVVLNLQQLIFRFLSHR